MMRTEIEVTLTIIYEELHLITLRRQFVMNIYLDNGATSFPKPPAVAEAMAHFINHVGSNVNRGSYDTAFDAGNVVYETREMLAELFNDDTPEQIVFSRNVTESLNMVIKGMLDPGDHVLVTSMEHNAVMRPLTGLAHQGITFSRIPCTQEGFLQVDSMEGLLTPKTRAVVMTHASNVCGSIMDVETVADFAKKHQLHLVIDAAQTAGVLPIDVQRLTPAAVCFTGHKSLYGPQGMGGAWLRKEFSKTLRPLVEGGTGSFSEDEVQPNHLPDKFESGTLNMPGIYGLHGALQWLKGEGTEKIHQHEMALTQQFLEGLKAIKGVMVVGPQTTTNRTAVVSIVCQSLDLGQLSHRLAKEHGIATRSGMHCAPNAHKTLGTFPSGTVRFSLGYFNTYEQVDTVLKTLQTVLT